MQQMFPPTSSVKYPLSIMEGKKHNIFVFHIHFFKIFKLQTFIPISPNKMILLSTRSNQTMLEQSSYIDVYICICIFCKYL